MIEIVITTEDGDVVIHETMDTYEEAGRMLIANKGLIKNIEAGGTGNSICPDCATEYPFGEDPEADEGRTCGRCRNGETD